MIYAACGAIFTRYNSVVDIKIKRELCYMANTSRRYVFPPLYHHSSVLRSQFSSGAGGDPGEGQEEGYFSRVTTRVATSGMWDNG